MDSEARRAYARRVMANPTWHRITHPHRDVRPEWIEDVLTDPYHQETDPSDGREVYCGWVDEVKNWVKVVVENDQLLTAYMDWRLERKFGRLS